ncbi:MAG: hypothetical protein A2Y97_05870 [Nitrospirae bacterium RBG_13_39_12]|nr:MAG: hypothetical protein A2Y97_05870 [Nitrospirae bacterium RBG_13_39_12]
MKLSREGKRFLVATVLIAVAALNTGNNLIYLILSMMLSMLVLSFLILKVNLNGLVLKVSQSQPIFANSPEDVILKISNKKKIIPSYSIKVMVPQKIMGEAYFPEVSGLSDISKIVTVIYGKRGIYRYGDFYIESSFPFIFCYDKVLCAVDGEVIVYPEIKNVDLIISKFMSNQDELSLTKVGRGDELSMIRRFRYGDDWRRIHWKASAKAAKFMVTEYAAEEPKKLTLILDNLLPHDSKSFEKAVSFAASVSDKFLNEGFFVRLLTCKKVIPFGNDRGHLFKILDVLAAVKGQDLWECPMSDEPEGLTILILNSGDSLLNRFVAKSDMVINAATL